MATGPEIEAEGGMMRAFVGTIGLMMALGASAANAQNFLDRGALAEGTMGYFAPGAPMALSEGRSASTGTGRLWCDRAGVLCYPQTFRITVGAVPAR